MIKLHCQVVNKRGGVVMSDDQADRKNVGKPQYSLIDYQCLEPMVRVLEFGALKYSRNNWKKGMPISTILDSLIRHVTALNNGEFIDPESGLSHIGHIQCNAMFLANPNNIQSEEVNNVNGSV